MNWKDLLGDIIVSACVAVVGGVVVIYPAVTHYVTQILHR